LLPRVDNGIMGAMDRHAESLLVTEAEAARLLALSPATLRAWRRAGAGPGAVGAVVRLGRAVRYSRQGLIEYIAHRAAERTKGAS